MKITLDLPDAFEDAIGDIPTLEKRLKIIVLVICDISQSPEEVIKLAKDWGVEAGNPAWETWLSDMRALVAQEATARAEAAGVPSAWGAKKEAPAGRKGRGNAKVR